MSPMCWLIQASRPEARQKVFLSSPHGQHGVRLERQPDRERRVAPRSADRQLLAVVDPHHGVVAGHVDRSVVDQATRRRCGPVAAGRRRRRSRWARR